MKKACTVLRRGAAGNSRSLSDSRPKFYICPSFFYTDFVDNNKNFYFGKRNDYDLERICSFSLFSKLCTYKSFGLCTVFHLKKLFLHIKSSIDQYKDERSQSNLLQGKQYAKFREIYNITKKRGMYDEQGDFFYLMHKSLEKSKRNNLSNRLSSKIYRKISDYGLNIAKPAIALLCLCFLCALLYSAPNIQQPIVTISNLHKLERSLKFSMEQIVKPYSFLFLEKNEAISNVKSDEMKILFYLILFFESTLAIPCIAMFIISLRWNFRRI